MVESARACSSGTTTRVIRGEERLVARGLSNVEIGLRLYIADTTVKTHVARVLGKLGLADRIHAVVFAYETGLIAPGDTLSPDAAS